jgi:hypothetical protein
MSTYRVIWTRIELLASQPDVEFVFQAHSTTEAIRTAKAMTPPEDYEYLGTMFHNKSAWID